VAGRIHTVFCLRTWDFSNLKSSGSEEYRIAKAIPVEGYREATLLVRVHSSSLSGASSLIQISVVEAAPTVENPEDDFEGTTLATVTVASSTTPALEAATLSAPFGGAVSIYVGATQDGSDGDALTADLSVDLVLKE
jgi:hypothetical protein